MTKETTHQINSRMSSDSSRFRNAARAAPLSGRHIPNQYMSPLDTRHLITPAEFETKYVAGKAGNRYTDNEDIVEIPERVSGNSVVRPNTPSTPVTATQRSDTATSVGSGTTYRDEDDHVSTGCFGFGKGSTRKRTKEGMENTVNEIPHKKPRRKGSWKLWARGEKEDLG